MNRIPQPSGSSRLRGIAVVALPLLALAAAFVACADSTENDGGGGQNPNQLPEASVDAGVDAADAGCAEDDPNCVSKMVPCEQVDWCIEPTSMNVLHTFTRIWGSSKNDVWAVGSGGSIQHYDGTTWTDTPSGVFNTLYSVWGSGPNDVWAVSDTVTVLHSTGFQNGTATWTKVETGISEWNSAVTRAVWGTNADDVRIGSRTFDSNYEDEVNGGKFPGHQLLKRTAGDGTITWQQVRGTPTVYSYWGASATDVWMTADNRVYVAAERGLIMHGAPRPNAGPDDDPLEWTSVDSQGGLPFDQIWGSSKDDIWAVGGGGEIRHYKTGDIRFGVVDGGVTVDLHGLWGTGPNDIWVVGDFGTILHWDGTSFTPATVQLPIGRKPNLYGIWGSAKDDIWIVGDGVALHFTGTKSEGGEQ